MTRPSRTGDLLSGRRAEPSRATRRRQDAPGHTTELGAHPEIRAYESGPYPALHVAPFPAEAVEILERRTGRRFDPDLLAEWERLRAWLGYEPFELTPELVTSRRLGDERDRGEPVAPTAQGRARLQGQASTVRAPTPAAGLGMPDPTDLGD